MGNAIGQFLTHAVGVAISPLALIAVILLVAVPRGGRRNAVAFALGWVLAVAGIFAGLLLLAEAAGAHRHGHPGTWVAWFRLTLGVLLALMTLRQLRLARAAEVGTLPRRLRNLEQFTTAKCVVLGVVLVVANPKNVMQIASGAVTTAESALHVPGQLVAGSIFVAISSLGVLIPLAMHVVSSRSSSVTLERWKDWTIRNHYVVMAVLFTLLSAKSLGDGISGLF
ncbi:GAP family protein [Nocardia sp. NPDC057668]|uniref:GAP family protein n=1 Tax=Nocardia sp. NPDC057668 TaxID=3346202 RepID=UPI003672D413